MDRGIAWFVVMVFALLALLLTFTFWLSAYTCTQTARTMGLESRYTIIVGCMIKPDDHWIPLENYRYFGEEK